MIDVLLLALLLNLLIWLIKSVPISLTGYSILLVKRVNFVLSKYVNSCKLYIFRSQTEWHWCSCWKVRFHNNCFSLYIYISINRKSQTVADSQNFLFCASGKGNHAIQFASQKDNLVFQISFRYLTSVTCKLSFSFLYWTFYL